MPETTTNLIDELREQGFTEGPPIHLSAELLMADLDSYSRMACEQCGKRRQPVLPFHCGEDYAIVTVCRVRQRCGDVTETLPLPASRPALAPWRNQPCETYRR